ncbi:unnamed protein product [Gongylonema pulchrum]|uniref:A2M_N_2 domain-containing protein n=1 Tax=Gongylonema pulchrum TaxID=637853 RepID=A0A183DHL5_9BILA|nr:unnamed protein product [Gongylonema pulchrum]
MEIIMTRASLVLVKSMLVSLTVDRTTAEPGNTVKFTIKADPESYCSLLAVDQSVLLLKSGNDITTDLVDVQIAVEQDVEQYDTTGGQRGYRPWEAVYSRRRRSLWYPWWGIGGRDAYTVFEVSCCFFLNICSKLH